uniref:Transposase (putative) gypsy type domain-containing protein n=1 Tax=Fagus sylvatica TaxID=28930 RepID=A0A2N9ITM6_FAGSY
MRQNGLFRSRRSCRRDSSDESNGGMTREVSSGAVPSTSRLRRRYQIPDDVVIRIPDSDERACCPKYEGDVAFYEADLRAGLRFPIQPFVRELLDFLSLAPGQVNPNGWRTIISCMVMWRVSSNGEEDLTVDEFLFCYEPVQIALSRGFWTFKNRDVNSRVVQGLPFVRQNLEGRVSIRMKLNKNRLKQNGSNRESHHTSRHPNRRPFWPKRSACHSWWILTSLLRLHSSTINPESSRRHGQRRKERDNLSGHGRVFCGPHGRPLAAYGTFLDAGALQLKEDLAMLRAKSIADEAEMKSTKRAVMELTKERKEALAEAGEPRRRRCLSSERPRRFEDINTRYFLSGFEAFRKQAVQRFPGLDFSALQPYDDEDSVAGVSQDQAGDDDVSSK